MERDKFLELCRRCAVLPDKHNIKVNITKDCIVSYNGDDYYPVNYILSFDKNGKAKHSVTLHSININSITITCLEKVIYNGSK